jgi:signal transduction histidine kinase
MSRDLGTYEVHNDGVGDDGAMPRTGWRAAALLAVAVASFIAGSLFEAANGERTENGSIRSLSGALVLTVLMAVPLAGFVAVRQRPADRPGWIMLWAGACLGVGSLAHGLAIFSLVTVSAWTPLGEASAWVATWMMALAVGLVPFTLARWPGGVCATQWMRRFEQLAASALAVVVIAQAFSPDHLDGVADVVIRNPLGVDSLADAVTTLTGLGVAVLLAFMVGCWIDLIRRYARGDRSVRRALRPPLMVLVAVVAIVLSGLLLDAAFGANSLDLAVLTAQVFAIGGLVLVSAFAANASRRRALAERERRLLVEHTESDRRRFRNDLHDGIGPILAALGLSLDVAMAGVDSANRPVIDSIGRSKALLSDALVEIRRVVSDLRPRALDELGLAGALRLQASELAAERYDGAPLAVVLSISEPLPNLPASIEVAVLRIVGEALTNVVRHAEARHCTIRLEVDGSVRLDVSDDGRGIERTRSSGLGLASMRRRAEELGGSFTISRPASGGTVLSVSIPVMAGSLR